MDFEKYFPKPFVPGQSHRTILQYDQFKAFRAWHISSMSISSIIHLIIGFTTLTALANLQIFIDVQNEEVVAAIDALADLNSQSADRAHLDASDQLKQLKLLVTSLTSVNNKLDSIQVSTNQNRDANLAASAASAVIESTILLIHQQFTNFNTKYAEIAVRDDTYHTKVLAGIDSIVVNSGDDGSTATIISNLEQIKASSAATLGELTAISGLQTVITEEITDVNVALAGIATSVGALVVLQQTTGIRVREHDVRIKGQPIDVVVTKQLDVISTRPASGHEWPVKPGSGHEWTVAPGSLPIHVIIDSGSITLPTEVTVAPAPGSVWETIVSGNITTIPYIDQSITVKPAESVDWFVVPRNSPWMVYPSPESTWTSEIVGNVSTLPILENVEIDIGEEPIIVSPDSAAIWKVIQGNNNPWLVEAASVVSTLPILPDIIDVSVAGEVITRPVGDIVVDASGSTVTVAPSEGTVWLTAPEINNLTVNTVGSVVTVNPEIGTKWIVEPEELPLRVEPAQGAIWNIASDNAVPLLVEVEGVVTTLPDLGTNPLPVSIVGAVTTNPIIDNVTVDASGTPVTVVPALGSRWSSELINVPLPVEPAQGSEWQVVTDSAQPLSVSVQGEVTTNPNIDLGPISGTLTVKPESGSTWEVHPSTTSVWKTIQAGSQPWSVNVSNVVATVPNIPSIIPVDVTDKVEVYPSNDYHWPTSLVESLTEVVVKPASGADWMVLPRESPWKVEPSSYSVWKVIPEPSVTWPVNVSNSVNTIPKLPSVVPVETVDKVEVYPASEHLWSTTLVESLTELLVKPASDTNWLVSPKESPWRVEPSTSSIWVVSQDPNEPWGVNVSNTVKTVPQLPPSVLVESSPYNNATFFTCPGECR